jgi:hypothetical protein
MHVIVFLTCMICASFVAGVASFTNGGSGLQITFAVIGTIFGAQVLYLGVILTLASARTRGESGKLQESRL